MKILEIVKFNNGFAYVVDEPEPLVYHEETVRDTILCRDRRMLVGESPDGRMDFLTFQHLGGHFKAFAGRELTLQMTDGSTRKVKDDWWSEGSTNWAIAHKTSVVGFTYNTLPRLADCYVFYGSSIRQDRLDAMLAEFKEAHPNYTPWAYDAYEKHCRTVEIERPFVCHSCGFDAMVRKVERPICPDCGSRMVRDPYKEVRLYAGD